MKVKTLEKVHYFDLEQQIMECWNVCSDIQTLIDNDEVLNDADRRLNLLIGLKEMYELKFDRMFNTFEEVVHDWHTQKKEWPNPTERKKDGDFPF